MEKRNKQIERSLRVQQILTFVFAALLCIAGIFSFKANDEPEVLRARGIVLVDSLGRERILIGSPIPHTRQRVRANMDKAIAAWAENYGTENFKNYYNKLDHSASGIIILDENGFDRIAIGNTVPDPNIGKRSGQATGMVINDERGEERSGYNVLNVKGQNRVVLGLDRDKGTEGLVVAVLEDGSAGVYASNKKKSLFLGTAPENSFATGIAQPFFGLILSDSSQVKHKINLEEKE